MRKLAVMLSLSLVLELLSPMQAYAQMNATNPVVKNTEYVSGKELSDEVLELSEDEEKTTDFIEIVENNSESGMEGNGEDETETEVSEREASAPETETSETEICVPETETLETEISAPETETSETEISVPETETSENTSAEMYETLSMNEVYEVSGDVVDISNQAYLHVPEISYPYENKGYPLTATFLLPQELVDTNLTIMEVSN